MTMHQIHRKLHGHRLQRSLRHIHTHTHTHTDTHTHPACLRICVRMAHIVMCCCGHTRACSHACVYVSVPWLPSRVCRRASLCCVLLWAHVVSCQYAHCSAGHLYSHTLQHSRYVCPLASQSLAVYDILHMQACSTGKCCKALARCPGALVPPSEGSLLGSKSLSKG